MNNTNHFAHKLLSTTRICATLFLARTFGTYVHSVGGCGLQYAEYRWRGKRWAIPTEPLDEVQP